MSIEEVDNYEADLEFVRVHRKKIISGLMEKGIPTDTEDRQAVLSAMADMDRTTLAKRKIKSDVNVGNTAKMAMEILANMYNDAGLKTMGKSATPINIVLPVLGTDIPAPVLVDGEMDIHPAVENFESFMSRTSIN